MTDSQDELHRLNKIRQEQKKQKRELEENRQEEEAEAHRVRQKAEKEAEALEAQKQIDEKRKARETERERFMAPDFSMNQRYRQASQRVYFMKKSKKIIDPRGPLFDLPRRADNLLARMKYADKQVTQFQKQALIENAKGEKELSELAYNKHDEAVKNFLYYCYGIGILYEQFVEGLEENY